MTASTEQGEVAACSPDRLKYRIPPGRMLQIEPQKGTAMNQRKMRIGMSIRGHGAALTPAEVEMWRQAVTAAEVAGTFFIAQAYHCAVATKPG